MAEIWETTFTERQLMWGLEATRSAVLASEHFAKRGVKDVLVPGIGYGRNARPFLERGMSVTGIEISGTAIALSRSQLGLDLMIHHGSVTDMPFDDRQYDGIFCHGLVYLLDTAGRAKLFQDCQRQLAPGGQVIFTAIAKDAPMFGRGPKLREDWYEPHPGAQMFFYDPVSIEREFGPFGLVEFSKIDEPGHGGSTLPFLNVVCERATPPV